MPTLVVKSNPMFSKLLSSFFWSDQKCNEITKARMRVLGAVLGGFIPSEVSAVQGSPFPKFRSKNENFRFDILARMSNATWVNVFQPCLSHIACRQLMAFNSEHVVRIFLHCLVCWSACGSWTSWTLTVRNHATQPQSIE